MPFSPLTISWEADYHDGKTIAERDGWSYDSLPREGLKSFSLIAPGLTLIRVFTDNLANHPQTLVYRRRQRMGADNRMYFLLGFVNGDVAAFFPHNDTVEWGRFGDESDLFVPPAPTPGENWEGTFRHGADISVKRSTIHLPSGYDLRV